jgi:glycosyltransferase involved in cell wall biosynthesis
MRSAFEAEAAQMGLQNFHFLGPRLDVPQILRRMAISVLATKNEGLSITLLEGMTSGCACIASDIPANRFVLDDGRCGLLVPNQDPAALAEAIERLLTDPELRAGLQEKAKERAAFFTSRRMAERYIELYRTLQPTRH